MAATNNPDKNLERAFDSGRLKNKKIINNYAKLFLLIASFLLLVNFAFAVPSTLNLHGRLMNQTNAIQAGTYNFTFRIYDAFTGGNVLYELKRNVTTDASGVYDVILPTVNLSFADQYYLGITVSTDAEATPRINLTSTPYSFRANVSESLNPLNDYKVASLNVSGNITTLNNTLFVNTLNGRMGIGTTSPGSKFEVSSSQWGQIALSDTEAGAGTVKSFLTMYSIGSTAYSAWSMNRNPATGVFGDTNQTHAEILMNTANADSYILFRTASANNTAATDRMKIDKNGNVGIGTTAPLSLLHVNGSDTDGQFRITNSSGTTKFFVNGSNVGIRTTAPTGMLGLFAGTADGVKMLSFQEIPGTDTFYLEANYLGTGSTGNWLTMRDWNSNNIMTWRGDGNVGIGTTAPLSTLHVNGSGAEGGLRITNGSSNYTAFFVNSSSGNVGIGTNAPLRTLHVFGSTDVLRLANPTVTDYVSEEWEVNGSVMGRAYGFGASYPSSGRLVASSMLIDATQPGGLGLSAGSSAPIKFYTATLQRMIIDSSGNVGIGTTAPLSTLHVNSSGTDGSFRITNASGNTTFFVNESNVGIGTTNPTSKLYVVSENTGTNMAFFRNNGATVDLTIGASTPETIFIRSGNSDSLKISSNGQTANHLFISTSGNIGLGTDAPLSTLHVNGSGAEGGLRITNGSSSYTAFFVNGSSGNVGIGTKSPAERLIVIGKVNISDSLNVSGTVQAARFVGDGSLLSGITASGDGTSPWNSSGTNVYLNESNGRVGIGTSTITEKLTVEGNFSVNNGGSIYLLVASDGNTKIGSGIATPGAPLHVISNLDSASLEIARIQNGGIGSPGAVLTFYGGSSESARIEGRASTLRFGTGSSGTERMRLDSGGQLGIGTTAPQDKLEIFNGSLRVNNSVFYVNGTSGNVGVGTANPSAKVEIIGGPNIRQLSVRGNVLQGPNIMSILNASGGEMLGVDVNGGLVHYGNNAAADFSLIESNAYSILFGTNNGEDMRLDANGNLGIGTTSPISTLTVTGAVTTFGRLNATSINATKMSISTNDGSSSLNIEGNISVTGKTNSTVGNFSIVQYNSTCAGFRFGGNGGLVLSCSD